MKNSYLTLTMKSMVSDMKKEVSVKMQRCRAQAIIAQYYQFHLSVKIGLLYRVFQVFESPPSFTLPRETITISGFADLISQNC